MRGDLGDEAALVRGAQGADVAFHVAAKAEDWGDWKEFRRVNVDGTKAVLAAARAAGVRRVVHVGTEAALLHGQPLVMADERTPLAFALAVAVPGHQGRGGGGGGVGQRRTGSRRSWCGRGSCGDRATRR